MIRTIQVMRSLGVRLRSMRGMDAKKCVSIALSLFIVLPIYAQSPADSALITFRTYKPSSPTVYVPGQFNNWGNNVSGTIPSGDPSAMAYNLALGAWIKSYNFKIKDPADTRRNLGDSVFQYKFNQGGSSSGWYSDPLNPEQNPSDNNNSVLRLTRLFWFQYSTVVASGQITRITVGLVHSNDQTITSLVFSTGTTQGSPLTSTDVTSFYKEGTRILDFMLASPIPRENFIRLVAHTSTGDSVSLTRGGYVVNVVSLPPYAKNGVTLPSAASQDSTTFRIRVSGKAYVLLRVAPLGQVVSTATPIVMRMTPDNSNWWINVALSPGTYEYVYEIENGKQIYDPWGRWTGAAGSRFTVGPEGLTADDYEWQSNDFQRPPLNRLVLYEMNVAEVTGGYFGTSGGFSQLAQMMSYFDSLGINGLELMPINDYGLIGASGFSWGYDVSHHFALEPTYGTPREFKALVDSAHAHGIAILVDVVFNHLNDPGPLWQMQPDAGPNPYFKLRTDLRFNEDPLFFFNDMDHWTDQTQEYVYEVLKMWIDAYRVDGFRYDYTQGIGWNVSEPTKGILGWANRIDQDYQGKIYQIAEHLPESPALIYYSGLTGGWHDSFHDRVFDEARFTNQQLDWLEDQVLDLGAFPGNDVPATPSRYANRTEPVNMTVDHDEQSLIYEMFTYQSVPFETAVVRDKLYATFMFASLGVPMLWEGMEHAESRGWRSDSEKLSYRPVQFSLQSTQRGQEHLQYYKALIRQRRYNPALYDGQLRRLFRYEGQKVLVWGFEDAGTGGKVMVVSNLSGSPQTVSDVPWLGIGDWYDIWDQSVFSVSGPTVPSFSLPAFTAKVYANEPDSVLLDVKDSPERMPDEFALAQNFPNPFNPATVIRFQLARAGVASLKIYDVLGREVVTLVEKELTAGAHDVTWNGKNAAGTDVGTGVYFYRLEAAGDDGQHLVFTKKLVLMR